MDKAEVNHNQLLNVKSLIREVVFGVEDGMVSTLGSITGIAVGSGDRYTVLLAGIVIIAVESISMGIGSFVSNMSSKEVEQKAIEDEKNALKEFPERERQELYTMFLRDGWSKKIAAKMTKSASLNTRLMLKEHEYRELGVFPYQNHVPLKNAFFMFISYIVGGTFPLIAYFLLPIVSAIPISVIVTLIGLFILGATTTIYTNTQPFKAGFRLFFMGGLAFLIGTLVGSMASLLQ